MIYLKLLGAAVVAVSAAFLGVAYTDSHRQIAAQLADLASALRSIADEVSALQTPLPQLMRRFSQSSRPCSQIFANCLAYHRTMSLGEAWSFACRELTVRDDEKNILLAIAPELGRLNCEAQSSRLCLCAERLEECCSLRIDTLRRDGKNPAALCVCAAVMLVIVLI